MCCVPCLSCIQRGEWEQHPGGSKCKLKMHQQQPGRTVASAGPILAKAAVGELSESVLHAACIGAVMAAGEARALRACWQHDAQIPPSRESPKAAEVSSGLRVDAKLHSCSQPAHCCTALLCPASLKLPKERHSSRVRWACSIMLQGCSRGAVL